jgi:hypothetical protein
MVMMILAAASQASESYRNRSIAGTVVRGADHQEIPGAEIVAIATDDQTCGGFACSGIDGRYRIDNLRPGNYSVQVLASGYPGPISRRVSIDEAGDATTVDFALNQDQPSSTPRSITLGDRCQIAGTVTKASDGAPLKKVSVVLESSAGDTTAFTLTSSNGTYSLPNIIPGSYTLWVTASDIDTMLISASRSVSLKRGKSYALDFAIRKFDVIKDPPCSVQGFVLEKNTHEPVRDVAVADSRGMIYDTTDADGRFSLENVPYGARDFVFAKTGYVTNYRRETLIPGESKSILLALVAVAKSKMVGPSGGVVEGANGAFVTLPPGALMQNTDISFTMLPSTDYFMGYNVSTTVNSFKILPDGIAFQQPALVTLPLLEMMPAGTEIPFSIFHSASMVFESPVSAKVTDDGRFVVFPISKVESYGAPVENCVWVMVQGSNFRVRSGESRKRTSQYCENNQSWDHRVDHPLGIKAETSVTIPSIGRYDISTQYDYNWSKSVKCQSDWCRRNYVEAVATAQLTGYVEMCVDRNLPPTARWQNTFQASSKRIRITSVTYLTGYSEQVEPSSNGILCESDNNLCTKDICQDGECIHTPNDAGIACKSACKECDPKTGLCLQYKCKDCEKCERVEAPIYGQCIPECITEADCPEPPDPCYRAICRSDGCCDQERLGDPPCDE